MSARALNVHTLTLSFFRAGMLLSRLVSMLPFCLPQLSVDFKTLGTGTQLCRGLPCPRGVALPAFGEERLHALQAHLPQPGLGSVWDVPARSPWPTDDAALRLLREGVGGSGLGPSQLRDHPDGARSIGAMLRLLACQAALSMADFSGGEQRAPHDALAYNAAGLGVASADVAGRKLRRHSAWSHGVVPLAVGPPGRPAAALGDGGLRAGGT